MADCHAGFVDMVVTKSMSRFGRNTVDNLRNVRELKTLGIDVFFEKENIHTLNSEGEVLLTLISAVAENESYSLSENVKWGIHRKYENGSVKSIPCGKFLGYDKTDGRLIINEEQEVTVRRIYKEFLDGYSVSQIAAHLTADGIPSEQGNAVWSPSSVRQILTNEKFKGDTLFQKTYNTDHLTKKRADNKGELPQYYLENSHPAIIDKNTWECVRLELLRQERYCQDHNLGKYHNHNEEHPLSARITCQTCGCSFVFLRSKRVGEEGRGYWRCSSFQGEQGMEIEGQTFTPPPMALWSKYPDNRQARYRAKHRKLPKERQMFCTDIQVPACAPEEAFVRAWNLIVSRGSRYAAAGSEDTLVRYRAEEMVRLISEVGWIDRFDYQLSLKVLDSRYARYRAKHRKSPAERQMLCTDIQIPTCAPEGAFVRAWNRIVSQGLRYETTESEDTLLRYRANEMVRLISEVGPIEAFDYELSLKVLDHIEVTPEGKLAVIFLDGTRITV